MIIRLEEEKDYLEVEKLVRDSFWNIYRPGAFEHYIVHNLRKSDSFIDDLAYVIEKDDKIIGHINYSKGKLNHNNDAVVLGPISIHKDFQNRGYGSRLIEYTLKLAKEKNFDCVFVIGDENYYKRFGFVSASRYNKYLEGTDTDDECPFFMLKIFNENNINSDKEIFTNPEEFDVNPDDVDEFDRLFKPKEKKVLNGQL